MVAHEAQLFFQFGQTILEIFEFVLLLRQRFLRIDQIRFRRFVLIGTAQRIGARLKGKSSLRFVLHVADLRRVIIVHFLSLGVVQHFEIATNIANGFFQFLPVEKLRIDAVRRFQIVRIH